MTLAEAIAYDNVGTVESMVLAHFGERVDRVLYDCRQFYGGFGGIRESAIERIARHARVQSIGGGATEVRLEEVGMRL